MLETAILVMGMIVIASLVQTNFAIPAPLSLLTLALAANIFGFGSNFNLSAAQFDGLIMLVLPLLIASDTLKIKPSELKETGVSLFYLAVVGVLLSVGMGWGLSFWFLDSYLLSSASIVILFSMVAATDPITVSALFARAKVSHGLKMITEGESLFNDATALILMGIGLIALTSPGNVSAEIVSLTAFKVIVGATLVGFVGGIIGAQLLKLSDDGFVETIMVLLTAGVTFYTAETYHVSGILAVIVSMVVVNLAIQKALSLDVSLENRAVQRKKMRILQYAVTNHINHITIFKNIDFLGMLASSIVFIELASIIQVSKLALYWREIVIVFLMSTFIRGVVMAKFAWVQNRFHNKEIRLHWWGVLTFAGSKGAISVLMVHLLPASFKYKEMFEYVVFGNVLLSIFLYAPLLLLILSKNKARFEAECVAEKVATEIH